MFDHSKADLVSKTVDNVHKVTENNEPCIFDEVIKADEEEEYNP